MAEFVIKDEDLAGLKGKVVVLTGGSSGIGLATAKLLLSLGASVVSGDIQSPTDPELTGTPSFLFVQTDVTNWADLTALFKKAKEHYGQVNYAFANAGIGPRANYAALEVDEKGELKEPTFANLEVNLKSVINTASLAVHYLKQQPDGGGVVLMGSSTGFQPIRAPDYTTAKHGVLGFGRGLARVLEASGLPIRVNILMPSWTTTNLLPNMDGLMTGISHEAQPGLVVARAAAYLMVTPSRNGEVVYASDGKYTEIEKAVLWPAAQSIIGEGKPSDDEILARMHALAAAAAAAQAAK